MKLAIIGYGTIVKIVLETLARELPEKLPQLTILCRESGRTRAEDLAQKFGSGVAQQVTVTSSLKDALNGSPDVFAEAAGHGALKNHGPDILKAGHKLIVTSVGALADDQLRGALDGAATKSTYEIIPGAVGGLDILSAVKLSGLNQVLYISRKPPAAWRGTAAEEKIDLNALTSEHIFFEGDAAQAATGFPQNANVAATIALKGAGFSATKVQLIADPSVSGNVHELKVTGNSADFAIRIEGRPAPENPKTSLTTAYSLAQVILEHRSALQNVKNK